MSFLAGAPHASVVLRPPVSGSGGLEAGRPGDLGERGSARAGTTIMGGGLVGDLGWAGLDMTWKVCLLSVNNIVCLWDL